MSKREKINSADYYYATEIARNFFRKNQNKKYFAIYIPKEPTKCKICVEKEPLQSESMKYYRLLFEQYMNPPDSIFGFRDYRLGKGEG